MKGSDIGDGDAHSMSGKMRGPILISMWWDEAWAKASSTLDTVNLVFGTTLDTDGAIAQEYNFVNGNSVVDPA